MNSQLEEIRSKVIEVLNEGPGPFKEWLGNLPQDQIYDANSACDCFFHNYLAEKAGFELVVVFEEVRPIQQTNWLDFSEVEYKVPSWFVDFQHEVFEYAVSNDEDNEFSNYQLDDYDIPVFPEGAIQALDTVLNPYYQSEH